MKATFWLTCLLTASLASPANAEVLNIPDPEMTDPAMLEPDLSEPAKPEAEQPPTAVPESEIPKPEAATERGTVSITLPGRGMTKDQVEDRFGTPTEKIEPVGEPPISRWVYGSFTVYFEYDHVIHAVHDK